MMNRNLPYFREHRLAPVDAFGSHRGVLRDFLWTPVDRARIRELQLYAVQRRRGYVATTTAAAAEFVVHATTLHGLLDCLRIGASASAASVETGCETNAPRPSAATKPPGNSSTVRTVVQATQADHQHRLAARNRYDGRH
jgi:hypothetical protein